MHIEKWFKNNTSSLVGKTVAITGSTGGLGKHICRYLASLGADLCLLDRNINRSNEHKSALQSEFKNINVSQICLDLENIDSVKQATKKLIEQGIDIFIHNAGAYSIPRHKCKTGYENVYQINFVSPYYMVKELMPTLQERRGRVVVVGSIAHNYSNIDINDVDFSTRKAASKVYGNAKRYLMFSLHKLFKNESVVKLAVAHPGITFTNITAHYPKAIFAIIKHPMKIIFMKPSRAALSIVQGVFEDCSYCEWIGPGLFNIWGSPRKARLKTCSEKEINAIASVAETIYSRLK